MKIECVNEEEKRHTQISQMKKWRRSLKRRQREREKRLAEGCRRAGNRHRRSNTSCRPCSLCSLDARLQGKRRCGDRLIRAAKSFICGLWTALGKINPKTLKFRLTEMLSSYYYTTRSIGAAMVKVRSKLIT